MRMLRGSGIAGLAAMARESERDGVRLARPLLDVSKSQLIATLNKAKIGFADDPTNRDTAFTRPAVARADAGAGGRGRRCRDLARLAARLARANAAVEVLADGAERYLALRDRDAARSGFDGFDAAPSRLPEEIRLRLLMRAIDRFGHEGPAELGKVEALLAALDRAVGRTGAGPNRLKQTLAGALISVDRGSNPRRAGAAAPPPELLKGRAPMRTIGSKARSQPETGGDSLNHPRKTPVSAPLFDRESR